MLLSVPRGTSCLPSVTGALRTRPCVAPTINLMAAAPCRPRIATRGAQGRG